MKKLKFKEVDKGDWFEFEGIIFAKVTEWERGNYGKTAVIYNNTEEYNDGQFTSTIEVNTDWWEALIEREDVPIWLMVKAYQEGAKIEFKNRYGGCFKDISFYEAIDQLLIGDE